MKNYIIMLLVFLLAFLGVPLVIVVVSQFTDDRLASIGLHTNPNYDGGTVIAQFADPSDDLLSPLPESFAAHANAFDIRSFAVARVAFAPLAGIGIAPRLNLVFEFDGQLPNPYDSRLQFSLPAIQVFLNAPDQSSSPVTSSRIPEIAFAGQNWDFQVCIDGLHEQARIYDTAGTLIGESLSLSVKHLTADQTDQIISETDPPDGEQNETITATRLTVALPLKLIGDPAVGLWNYYVVVGLPDLNSPGGMDARPFDCLRCRPRETDGVIELQPLNVEGK
jgi:hypothetical protein